MRTRSNARTATEVALVILVVSACGASGEAPADGDRADPGRTGSPRGGGTLDMYLAEPTHLFPPMAGMPSSTAVVSALFSPLITYAPGTGEPVPVVASEVPTSDDAIHWTIRISDGWTFHNGEAVTAASFVDAWNWAAYGPNATGVNQLFGPGAADVVGYADMQGGADPDGDGPQEAVAPAASEMSGLDVVNNTTFTVELAEPLSQFPVMLGQRAFYPLPSVCLADWESCNETPIGNGPFRMDGSWKHDQGISVRRYESWAGSPTPSIDGIEFKIFADDASGLRELEGGRLDFMTGISREAWSNAKAEFDDRVIAEADSTFLFLALPFWDPVYGGPAEAGPDSEETANLRHALSMAINRAELIDEVFDGALEPAYSLVSPIAVGHRADACAEYCEYDVEAARALYEQSSKIDGPITFLVNEGGPSYEWLTRVGDYWQTAFGIEYHVQTVSWPEFLAAQENHTHDSPFWFGWAVDFPSVQNSLMLLYGGHFGYANPEADALIDRGDAAPTIEAGLALYQRAEDLFFEDMPVIPIWFGRTLGAYNANVSNVALDRLGNLDYTRVTVSG